MNIGYRGGYSAPAGGRKPQAPTTGSGVPNPLEQTPLALTIDELADVLKVAERTLEKAEQEMIRAQDHERKIAEVMTMVSATLADKAMEADKRIEIAQRFLLMAAVI